MTKKLSPEEMLITKLSDEERKSVEERLKTLQYAMHNCEVYLRDYMAGEQNAFKFLTTIGWVHGEIEKVATELMKVHELPNFPSFWGNL